MTHHDTPRTPRTDAEHFINRARTTTHLVDLPGIGEVATAAAILDLADAIRETGQPTVDYAEAGHETDHRYDCGVTIEVDDDDDDAGPPAPRCPAEGCGRVDGHEGVHLVADPITLPPITMKRGGIRYDAPAVVCGVAGVNGTCRREPGHGGLHHDEHGGVYMTGQDTATMTRGDVQSAIREDAVVDNRPQIDKLAQWIAENVDGEPSRSEGAGDTAIRIIDELQTTVSGQRVLMNSYQQQIAALVAQIGEIRDQRDRESDARAAAQDDLASTTESRDRLFETAKQLSQAIVHTVEYVGNDMLPAIEGWSWYDALRKFDPDAANRFLTNPVHLTQPDDDWFVVRTGPDTRVYGPFHTADQAHTWATDNADLASAMPTILRSRKTTR
ncbi:hypothetical protein SEA_TARDUS_61 [Gordonia phage Tardus]|uniref:Uncharacterized protein n=1 Tax=Gordonia phage Tardus TaxID=2939734 RepID=A0A9E7J751_9CAUD|nr:hypothetical protein SEA_TARDUS_61 [Gordonia phage Tardus]